MNSLNNQSSPRNRSASTRPEKLGRLIERFYPALAQLELFEQPRVDSPADILAFSAPAKKKKRRPWLFARRKSAS
ncbi:MAG: hypothetical protein H0T48_07310 [Gemmatimonadaceae bacterium]|nr:hypothetical protein [Gemmatimonadaceae bacterium]